MSATFRSLLRLALFVIPLGFAGNAFATFHLFVVDQIYTNANGSIQFIVFQQSPPADNEHEWQGHTLKSIHDGVTSTFVYPHELPSNATRNRKVLVATQGFADLGIVAPDFVMPNGFLGTGAGRVTCCDGYEFGYAALPVDGVNAIDAARNVVPNLATNFTGVSASVTAAPAAFSLNQHGLTGSWYEPATSGQGVEVEIFPDLAAPGTGVAQVSWFTFDATAGGADHQRWYTLGGQVGSGQPSAALTIYRNTGGNFVALPITTAQAVGTASLSFDTCATGSLSYTFTDGSGRTGSIPLTRLTKNVTCDAGAARPTNADFALSGNWFDPVTSGQGITVEVNPSSNALFFAWYTYAPNGAAAGAAGQRWYTGLGNFAAGARSVAVQLYETTGGVFNAVTPAASTVAVGTGTIAFQGCAGLTLAYAFTSGSMSGKTGTQTLQRVGPVPAGCLP